MISCEIGTGTSYVNQNLQTGLVVRLQSPEELSGAMHLLLEDSAMTAEMGNAARTQYGRFFRVKPLVRLMLRCIEMRFAKISG